MDQNALVSELSSFLINEPACQQALSCLSTRAEIEIIVADTMALTVCYKDGQVLTEQAKATAPDFIFKATPRAIEILIAKKGLSVAQLGTLLAKQVVGGDISVSMPANLLQVTQKGYLKIVKLGGMDLMNELRSHNLTSLPKIISALKKLKKS